MRTFRFIARVCALLALAGVAAAQSYPAKPVRIIVPYAAGGGVDILARVLGGKLTEVLGSQFIVDNRPGAGTVIGTEMVARASADGYTLLFTNAALTATPALTDKVPYDTLKSFIPVSLVAGSYNVLVVHPSVPAKSVKELVALAKAKPGQLNYASGGTGSAIHLAMEVFRNATGIDVVHIPYKGAGPALAEVVGGQVPMMFATPPAAIPYIKANRLRPLGASSPQRIAVLPGVPTIAESGYPGFEVNNWYGLLAPSNTPHEVIERLNGTIVKVLALPDVAQRIAALGAEPQSSTPQQFGERLQKELATWQRVLRKAK